MRTALALLVSTFAQTPAKPAPAPAPAQAADAAPTVLTAEQTARDAALEPKAAAFIDAYANYAPSLLRDGRVVFLSTRGSVPALYLGNARSPAAAAKKLAAPDERALGPVLLAGEHAMVFMSDAHADGNFRIFRTRLDREELTNLTPDETLHRDRPVAARKKPLIAYAAHAASERAARVFLQDAERGGKPTELYRDEQGGEITELSPDGAHILFLRVMSDDEQILFELDAATKKATRVHPAEGAGTRIPAAAYSADGKRILLVTEALDHPSRLIAVDRAGKKELARYEETIVKSGSIDALSVSPAGDRIAITVDAGNHSELRILDAKTLALVKTVDTGLGAAFLGAFRADGAAFAISLARADAPRDIFSVDVKTGAVTSLRSDTRPGLESLPKPKSSIEEITSFDGTKVPVNLYLPSGRSGKLPVYVQIHGGPSGSAYLRWSTWVAFFSAMGFAVVEPNIRGSSGFGISYQRADDKEKRGDALRDVEAVNRWARAQPWCDPERIVIGGVSYGGYMTLLALSRQPSLWRAGINASGMSDLRTMEKLEDQVVKMYDETEFGVLGKEDELLWEWSPLKYVGQIAAPLFVYQGVHDPISPQNEADQIVRAVRARRLPVEYMLLADEGHGVTRRENNIRFLARSYRFLAEHLGLQ